MKVNLDYNDLRYKGVMKCSSRSHPNNTDYTLGFPFNYDFVLYVHRLTLYVCLHHVPVKFKTPFMLLVL